MVQEGDDGEADTIKSEFNIPNDAQTSLTESAVQEIFWVVEDCDEIRSIEVKGRFIKTSSSGVHFLVMTLDAEFMEKYKFTIPRVTREGADVNVFFDLPPPPSAKGTKDNMFWKAAVAPVHIPEQPHDGNLVLKVREPLADAPAGAVEVKSFASYSEGEEHPMVSKRRVAAIGKVFQYTTDAPTQDKKKRKRLDDDDDDDDDTDSEDDNQETSEANPDTSTKADKMNTVAKPIKANGTQKPTLTQKDIDHLFSMNLFLKDFLLGRGFNSLLLRDDIDDLTSQLSQTALHSADGGRSLPQMPKVDFFHGTDLHMIEVVLSRLRPDAKDRFTRYVKLIPLGLISIFGFAGSGKTKTLAITAHLFLTKFSLVYASVPTHVATTNFASRCYRVGRDIVEAYNNTVPRIPNVRQAETNKRY
ncbi:uncharacterized protein NECHADRAFT_75182 [Fusarium vanettenii 77-13-4]|uniref:DNA2/NAM7 helicase helicase domain-containing protein n=1 Tax=Fusarium vanettenii (strain ATCC MYA-4622 / CBS 123669 / FGSC 9596 / NRRL 45880 / 77-13-4) TaxID=660122 RepID=C7YI35_FUSV7|nr:uncharacterized protein NECHADRAFT_75182 [Fusarium vanettenii 77-13-4]EEU48739.1 predicted protein [Fusarium vanettenii 77-13-4]